jgi:hypothetical protein
MCGLIVWRRAEWSSDADFVTLEAISNVRHDLRAEADTISQVGHKQV